MKAKGMDISYPKIREQMKNHYDAWGGKIRMLNDLLTLTSVGYDAKIEFPIVDDKRWENIVQNYPAYEGMRAKPVQNANKLRFLFFGHHASNSMSFSPGMSSNPRVTSKKKSIQIVNDEGTRDSDDVDQEEGQEVERPVAYESRSPPRSLVNARATERGPSSMFQDMNIIERNAEMEFFLSFKIDDLAWCYVVNRLTAKGMSYLL